MSTYFTPQRIFDNFSHFLPLVIVVIPLIFFISCEKNMLCIAIFAISYFSILYYLYFWFEKKMKNREIVKPRNYD